MAGLLRRAVGHPALAHRLELLPTAVVVFDRGDRLVLGHVEVVVEVAAVGRVPRKRPTLAAAVVLDLGEGSPRHRRERRVPLVQVLEQTVGHLVRPGRAARAAVVPARVEHEVLHDQLSAPFEEVGQRRLSLRSFEDVVLLDPHHRELSALGVEGVPRPRHGLLLGEQRYSGSPPFLRRHDLRQAHGVSLHSGLRALWAPGNLGSGQSEVLASSDEAAPEDSSVPGGRRGQPGGRR